MLRKAIGLWLLRGAGWAMRQDRVLCTHGGFTTITTLTSPSVWYGSPVVLDIPTDWSPYGPYTQGRMEAAQWDRDVQEIAARAAKDGAQ